MQRAIRRFWRSTFGPVVLVTLGFSAATIGIALAAYEITHEALEEQLDHRIAVETSALLSEARERGLPRLVSAIDRREAARSTASLEYLLLDGAGQRLAGGMIATPPAHNGYEEHLSYHRGGRRGVAQSITTGLENGRLIVAADRSGLHEIDGLLTTLFSTALAAMLLAGVAAAAFVAWITRRRLSRIDRTALAIIDGQFDRRVPQDGSGSEFDHLAGTLNRMLDRIAGLMDNLRQVSSDVAHDLRTPLTRLHNRLERALDSGSPAEQAQEIEQARTEAAELLEIFAALLRIAEVEGMGERLPRLPVDLSLLLTQMAETYAPDMEASGHIVSVDIEPGLIITGDRRLLNQAVANLLDNSLRHTPPGTHVTLTARRTMQGVELLVADDGPGTAEANMTRLFQRFARSEKARSTPGHGLGLALVAAVAQAHRAAVSASTGNGFEVSILFPV